MPTLTAKRVIKYGSLILGTIGLLFYIYIQSRIYLEGPQLTITSPAHGTSVEEQLLTIEGNARNVSFVEMNGNQIFIDSEGDFREKLLLDPGYNIIEVTVTDRFERSVSSRVQINYTSKKEIAPKTFNVGTSSPALAEDTEQYATSTDGTENHPEE